MSEHLGIGFIAGIIIYFIYLSAKCRFQVNEGNIAVLSSFGSTILSDKISKQIKIYNPGLHFKWPWQKNHTISIMEQMIELSGEEGGTMAMASDGTLLRLDSKLRFTPLKNELYAFLFSMEKPVEHIKGLFTCLLHNEISSFDSKKSSLKENNTNLNFAANAQVGSYSAMRRERSLLNQHIQDFCRHEIGDRYGIRFDGVDLTDILPPDELAQSLNGVINAQSEAQRLYAQTEAECEQRLLAAKKGITIAQARAKATEEEIGTMAKVLSELQKNETLKLYIERRKTEVFSESRISYIKRPI